MQPLETALPIDHGALVPWMAIGPPCVQPVRTFENAETPTRAGAERAALVRRDEPLVDVEAPGGSRRRRRADRGDRAQDALAVLVERDPLLREVDEDPRRDLLDGHLRGRHPGGHAVRPLGDLDEVRPRLAGRIDDRAADREDRRDAVDVQPAGSWRRRGHRGGGRPWPASARPPRTPAATSRAAGRAPSAHVPGFGGDVRPDVGPLLGSAAAHQKGEAERRDDGEGSHRDRRVSP